MIVVLWNRKSWGQVWHASAEPKAYMPIHIHAPTPGGIHAVLGIKKAFALSNEYPFHLFP